MSATIYERLTRDERNAVAERFLRVMQSAARKGPLSPAVTSALRELHLDAEVWVTDPTARREIAA